MTRIPTDLAARHDRTAHERLASRLQLNRTELARNGWVTDKDGGVFAVRWRQRTPDGQVVQRTIRIGRNARLAAAVRRLLLIWKRRAGTLPPPRVRIAMSLLRGIGTELRLHPRARRRLGAMLRQARLSGDDRPLFALQAGDPDLVEHLLYGKSRANDQRRADALLNLT